MAFTLELYNFNSFSFGDCVIFKGLSLQLFKFNRLHLFENNLFKNIIKSIQLERLSI